MFRRDKMTKENYLFTLYKGDIVENRSFETITNDSDAYEMARQLEKSLKLDKVLIFKQYVEWQWVGELENGVLSWW